MTHDGFALDGCDWWESDSATGRYGGRALYTGRDPSDLANYRWTDRANTTPLSGSIYDRPDGPPVPPAVYNSNSSDQQEGDSGGAETAKKIGGGIAVAGDVAHHAVGKSTVGTNMGYYRSGWSGNQYVRTASAGKIANAVGHTALGVTALMDTRDYLNGQVPASKYFTNRAVDAAGLLGGPPGQIGAAGYYLLDTIYPGGAGQAARDFWNAQVRQATLDLQQRGPYAGSGYPY